MVSVQKQDITYTSFSMPATIIENGNTAGFTYGPDHERKVLVTNLNGGTNKYYSGQYERQDVAGATRELHYIVAYGQIVAIFEKKSSGETNVYYVHTDHLGSLNVLTNASAAIVQETSYDAWGNRRDPATLQNYTTPPSNLITDRGFTGHEHLDVFKLINMNGRIYDPALGRFLSPDNYVQSPNFTQSYNRYSYCMNNPLMFTDPSGMMRMAQPKPSFVDDGGGFYMTGFGCHGGDSPYYSAMLAGEYSYDWNSGTYLNGLGQEVSFGEVNNNYVLKNSAFTASNVTLENGSHTLACHDNGKTMIWGVTGGWADPSEGTHYNSEIGMDEYSVIHLIYDWHEPYDGQIAEEGEERNSGEFAKFMSESSEKYFALTSEAFHNELYWMQKNGAITFTKNIGSNYLLRRSYSLVGQTLETSKIIAKGLWRANMAYAVVDYGMTAITTGRMPSAGKGWDLFATSVAVIPGWGWMVSGAYWITSAGFYIYTGKTLGEHIDEWVSEK